MFSEFILYTRPAGFYTIVPVKLMPTPQAKGSEIRIGKRYK